MGRIVSFGAHQVKVRPRPLVGTKTFILKMQRLMRDIEWSDAAAPIITAMIDEDRKRRLAKAR